MVEQIPFPRYELGIVKKLRTLGGAVLHLATRHLGDQPLASHGEHFTEHTYAPPEVPDKPHLNRWDSEGNYYRAEE